MITTSAEHIALLNTRIFWGVDLYQITFFDGSSIYLTSGGKTVTWNGQTWSADCPLIKRGTVTLTRGLDTNSLDLTIRPRSSDTLLGISWYDACRNGALDGAVLTLYRGHAATPGGTIVGAVMRFKGPVDEVECDIDIKVKVKDFMNVLGRQFPRAVFQAGCDRALFDAGCTLSRSSYATSASILSGSTVSILQTGLTQDAGYYTAGELRVTSGNNAGARRTVRKHASGGVLTLAYPLTQALTVGDAFTIYPGCDGTWATCGDKFGNQAHFRGEPMIPVPETTY